MSDPTPEPSFTPQRKWTIGLNVGLLLLLVASAVLMVNYLSRDYFHRFHWSRQSANALSPRTVHFLNSLTNRVKVTIYYDRDDPFYSTVLGLLNEYSYVNSRISVRTVDYTRDAGSAQQLLSKLPWLASANAKNLVIFECGEKVKAVEGNDLAKYAFEQDTSPQKPDAEKKDFRMVRKATHFIGETAFTATLLDVTSSKRLAVYFLKGHGEHSPDNDDKVNGYTKFLAVLKQNYLQVDSLALMGTNAVPADCNLLIIAGPTTPIPPEELAKIEQYLSQGGRLLCLFNAASRDADGRLIETGPEKLLRRWGVGVAPYVIKDPDAVENPGGSEVIVSAFSKHVLVNPIAGLGLYLYLVQPRPVGRLQGQPADAPHVEMVAYSGPRAYTEDNPAIAPRQFPLIVVVEKADLKGVITEHGTTRMVIVGESQFLNNHYIDSLANRDFANCTVNWLLERPQLFEGIGPKPINDYRFVMTKKQSQGAAWILLVAQPGAVLLLGVLVWLRRRR
jgi:hypothetical protein